MTDPATPAPRELEAAAAAEWSPGPGASFPSFAETAAGLLGLLWSVSALDVLLVTCVDVDSDTQQVVAAMVGGDVTLLSSRPWSGSVCVHMAAGTAPQIAPRLADVAAYAGAPNLAGTGLASYAGVAVRRSDGLLYGTVCGFGRTPRDERMYGLLPAFHAAARVLGGVLVAADAAEERLTEMRSSHAREMGFATTDPVTRLANRTGLEQAVAREQARRERHGHALTVVMCDVDDLKAVNDRGGHAAGDALLRRVADRLHATSRASDVLGRVGGDEFLILLPGENRGGAAVARLRRALAGLPVSLGAADTTEHPDLDALRRLADQRMYEDKREHKQWPRAGP